ncbi:energy-coupling factor transporter transmembrane protein EcfT [Fusibacter paucivorans]|uniref:Energy-coupling factor transporter transmembrane protein EcfT n=1 Tax=Fusibacter paucivorans TaxID=76009 RepID=A0ABS5PP01_9FIRM|nr:energy-coupling factor transporter transmembrane component T [Fusibacter paucivorans]MBS7526895.1 energy-coupling factor transporter transmembrane protein EcfT [Fusibacter paucivorans]
MKQEFDPRVKLLAATAISTVGVLSASPVLSLVNFLVGLVMCSIFKVNLLKIIRKMKRFLGVCLALIVIQSLFDRSGSAILLIGKITILTDVGMYRGINYLFRVLIILISGMIISTSSMKATIQGFVQLGLPYEFGFMVGLGIRFLPLLTEEIRNTYVSMALRGIDVNRLPIAKRLAMIGSLFIPIVYATLLRGKALAESAQSRGFVIGGKRSTFEKLKFGKHDYIGAATITLVFAMLLVSERLVF